MAERGEAYNANLMWWNFRAERSEIPLDNPSALCYKACEINSNEKTSMKALNHLVVSFKVLRGLLALAFFILVSSCGKTPAPLSEEERERRAKYQAMYDENVQRMNELGCIRKILGSGQVDEKELRKTVKYGNLIAAAAAAEILNKCQPLWDLDLQLYMAKEGR